MPDRSYWLIAMLTAITILLPDLIIRSTRRYFFPADNHVIAELENNMAAAQKAEAQLGRRLSIAHGIPVWKDKDAPPGRLRPSPTQAPPGIELNGHREAEARAQMVP